MFKPFRSHNGLLGWVFRCVLEDLHRFQRGFLQRDASMRALWSDRPNCSHNVCLKNLNVSGASLRVGREQRQHGERRRRTRKRRRSTTTRMREEQEDDNPASWTEKVPQRTFATKILPNFQVNFVARFASKPLFYWVVALQKFIGFEVLFRPLTEDVFRTNSGNWRFPP